MVLTSEDSDFMIIPPSTRSTSHHRQLPRKLTRTHGPNYVPDKDEAIAMAFVAASEDGIDGTGKKTAVFQAEIFAAFKMKWAVLGLNKIIGPLVALAHNPKMVHS